MKTRELNLSEQGAAREWMISYLGNLWSVCREADCVPLFNIGATVELAKVHHPFAVHAAIADLLQQRVIRVIASRVGQSPGWCEVTNAIEVLAARQSTGDCVIVPGGMSLYGRRVEVSDPAARLLGPLAAKDSVLVDELRLALWERSDDEPTAWTDALHQHLRLLRRALRLAFGLGKNVDPIPPVGRGETAGWRLEVLRLAESDPRSQ